MFCDRCAPDLNNTTRPLLDDAIKCTFQVVLGDCLPIFQPSLPHFCAIVAVMEVDGTSQTFVIMAFREFQESETHDDRFRANPYAHQKCSGVGYHACPPSWWSTGGRGWEPEYEGESSLCHSPLPLALPPVHTRKIVFPPPVDALDIASRTGVRSKQK